MLCASLLILPGLQDLRQPVPGSAPLKSIAHTSVLQASGLQHTACMARTACVQQPNRSGARSTDEAYLAQFTGCNAVPERTTAVSLSNSANPARALRELRAKLYRSQTFSFGPVSFCSSAFRNDLSLNTRHAVGVCGMYASERRLQDCMRCVRGLIAQWTPRQAPAHTRGIRRGVARRGGAATRARRSAAAAGP